MDQNSLHQSHMSFAQVNVGIFSLLQLVRIHLPFGLGLMCSQFYSGYIQIHWNSCNNCGLLYSISCTRSQILRSIGSLHNHVHLRILSQDLAPVFHKAIHMVSHRHSRPKSSHQGQFQGLKHLLRPESTALLLKA